MAEIQFNVNMDLVDKYVPAEDITIPQEDNLSVKFTYSIFNREVSEDLTGATNIVVSYVKPDGHIVLQSNGALELPNKVNIVANTQAFTYVGKVYMQVQYKKGAQTFNTRQAFFWVEKSGTSCTTVASSDFAPYLDNVIATGEMLNGIDLQALIDSKQTAENAQADVDALTPRVTTLETDVSSLKARVTAVETKNTQQDTRLTSLENQQGTFATSISNLQVSDTAQNTRLTNLESGQTTQDTRITAIETKNTTQDSNISNNATAISALQTSQTAQDAKIANLEAYETSSDSRITAVETKNTQQDSRLTNLEGANSTQDTRLTAVENKNTAQDTRLADLEVFQAATTTKDTQQDNRLTAIETKNTSQDASITALNASEADHETRLTNLESSQPDLTPINNRLTAVETKNTAQDTRLTDLETAKTANDTKNTQQDTRLTSLENGASSLATTVANNKTAQDTVNASTNSSLTSLTTRVTATETKNTQQDTRLDAVEAKNTSQDTKIATLEGANSVIIADIDALESSVGGHEVRLDDNDTKNASQDSLIASNSSAISSLTTTVNNNQTGMNTRVTALETAKTANDTKNTQQDSRLTALENYDTTQDTRMTAIEGVNTTQNTRLTNVETKNTEQDTQISDNTKKVMALRNAQKKLNIMCYDGDNQAIHTSTQYFPNGWNGYKFWMAYTPYTFMDEFVENPSMACSNDGITWVEPVAGLNPMNAPLESERGQKHNSDTSLVYRADLNRLEIWWRRVDRTLGTTFLMRRTSTNGTTWTATETINNNWGVCPVVKYENGKYRLWCYASSVNKIRYGEATEPSFNFGVAREIDTYTTPFEGKNYNMWHFDIRQNEQGLYEMLGSYKAVEDTSGETQQVFYSYSTDNITYSTPKIFMKTGRLGNFDSKMTYKPDFVKVGDKLHLYMTGKSVDQTWGTGLSISDTGNLFDVLGAGNDFMLGYPSQKSVTQGMIDASIAPLGTRMTAVETKNTNQDTAINSKLTKSGDEITGNLTVQVSNGGKQIKGRNGTDDRSGILFEDDGFRLYDWQNNRGVFQYIASSNTFNIQSTNTNLITKARDDSTTLPLTADATNVDTNYPPRMTRRGNTVTIQGSIRRNAGSASGVIATLPSTMRPITDLESTVIDTAGAAVPFSISASNGNIFFNVADKHVKLIVTYVVN